MLRRLVVVSVVLALVASATIVPSVAGAPVAPVVEGDFGGSLGTSSAATFTVAETGVPEQAAVGEQLDVSTRLVNEGSLSGLQSVTFHLDVNGDGVAAADEVVGSLAVALPAGGARVVSIPASVPADLAPGEYRYALVTADETIEGTITVGQAANFDLAVDAPSAATQGDSLTVGALVANRGDLNGTTPVTFSFDANGDGSFDESEVTTRNLTLAGGATGSVPFGLNVSDDLAPGEYRYRVSVDGVTRSGKLTVEQPAPEFSVPSVRGPSDVRTGGSISIAAIVENDGDERRTGEVGVYLDLNGDGEYTADERVRSRTVELGPGSSEMHSFSVSLPDEFTAGNTYSYAVATDHHVHAEEFEVTRSSSSKSSEPAVTRDDVAQALYGTDFAELDADQAWQAEDVYDRLPLADGVTLEDVRTLDQIAQEKYDSPWLVQSRHKFDADQYTLTRSEAIDVQNTYDAQFGPLPEENETTYTREQITDALFPWVDGTFATKSDDDFNGTDAWEAARVQAVYNRQPYGDGVTAEDIQTRRQLLNNLEGVYLWEWQSYGSEISAPGNDLTLEDILRIQETYDAQFGDE